MVWPSHHSLAQNYYDLETINVEWSGPLTTVSPKIIMTLKKLMLSGLALSPQSRQKLLQPRKNKCKVPKIITRKYLCRVVWPSHFRDAQNYYNLEKINVEWSGPLTTMTPKNITTSKK